MMNEKRRDMWDTFLLGSAFGSFMMLVIDNLASNNFIGVIWPLIPAGVLFSITRKFINNNTEGP